MRGARRTNQACWLVGWSNRYSLTRGSPTASHHHLLPPNELPRPAGRHGNTPDGRRAWSVERALRPAVCLLACLRRVLFAKPPFRLHPRCCMQAAACKLLHARTHMHADAPRDACTLERGRSAPHRHGSARDRADCFGKVRTRQDSVELRVAWSLNDLVRHGPPKCCRRRSVPVSTRRCRSTESSTNSIVPTLSAKTPPAARTREFGPCCSKTES